MTYTWGRRIIAAVLAGFATALTVHFGTILSFGIGYLGNSTSPTSFPLLATVWGYFQLASVIAFILIGVAGLVGAFSRWWTALISAAVIAFLATSINTVYSVTHSGTKLSGQVFLYVFESYGAINLVFTVALIVLIPTLGRWMFYRIADYRLRPTDPNRIALVRIPASNLSEGIVTHGERTQVDSELADQQWDAYVAALTDAGWKTVEVAPADKSADSVFVEDTAVLFGRTGIITAPGAESRRGETAGTEAALRELGLDVARIEEPGTLDGGDVLKVGTTVYVGRSDRTNAEGVRQLRAFVAPLGYTVVAVHIQKALHLKTVATALPDGTVIGYAENLEDVDVFDRFLPVPEPEGASVVIAADDHVIMSASAPRSAALVEDLGYRVTTVDISEFEKLEGGVTCLSVRVR
jgi:dimethylargininase